MPTLSQFSSIERPDAQRSAFAWACVDEAGALANKQKKAYENLVKELPILIKNGGLCQVFADLYAKAQKEAHRKLLFMQLAAYLTLKGAISEQTDVKVIMQSVINLMPNPIRYCADETLAMLEWLKRYSTGTFGGLGA